MEKKECRKEKNDIHYFDRFYCFSRRDMCIYTPP